MQSIRAILVRSSAPYQATVSALVSTVRSFLACISSAITIRTYRITAKIHSSSIQFLILELLLVTMPRRLHSAPFMTLPMSKLRPGHIGMRAIRGEVLRAYEGAGMIFHVEELWRASGR